MKKTILASALVPLCLALPAFAADAPMTLQVKGISDNQPIPDQYAFCKPDGKGATADGGNVNPQVSWGNAPAGTKSFALLVVDPDVPANFDNANKAGKEIADAAPRQDFYHWVVTDIPPSVHDIAEGTDSKGMTQGGKATGKRDYGTAGTNDYAKFMKGTFGGYDGPCPPWNDARLHHYHFKVYALDVPSLDVKGTPTGPEVETAMKGHVLGSAEVVGTYSDNEAVLAQMKSAGAQAPAR